VTIEAEADAAKSRRPRRLAWSTAIFAAATGVSRVLGLFREIVARRYFGVEGEINAFTVAFQVPNLVRALAADMALGAAFIPVFSELLEKEQRERAWRLASSLIWLILIVLGAATGVFFLVAPWVMSLFGGPYEELATTLSRLLFPIVILLGVSGIITGILNSYDEFTVPALMPVLWNLAIIISLVVFVPRFDSAEAQLYVYAGGILAGTVIQAVTPVWWLRGKDGRIRAVLDLRDPALKRVFVLMLPITLGVGLINFNLVINTFFASRFVDPTLAPSAIDAAFRIYMLPQGIFSVAVATVLFPRLSRLAARNDIPGFRDTVSLGLRQIGFLLLPASAVGAVLAVPIVRLLYERGAFDADQTQVVAGAFAAFALGLTFNGTMLMLNRAFFSLQSAWIPTAIALGNLALNVVLNAFLYRVGVWGIPLATSIVNIAGTAALLIVFRRRLGRIDGRRRGRRHRLRGLVRARRGLRALARRADPVSRGRGPRRRRRIPRPRRAHPRARAADAPLPPPAISYNERGMSSLDRIRNFSIVAHIDHGKSTLADRILELTQTLSEREMREQVLDSMELERERGITIKAQAVRVIWRGHQLNLIDTPGHVDFTYEVSRALQACEGALLVVDAAQGIEAQTLANAYLAIENDLEIVPVVNKIDLPQADPDAAAAEVAQLVGEEPDRVIRISAKTGEGVEAVLDAVVDRIPPPVGDPDAPPRALVFDSSYDQYRGVVAFVRMIDGRFSTRQRVRAMAAGTRFEAEELGFFSPDRRPTPTLDAGEVGYVVTGLKEVSRLRVGDTLTAQDQPAEEPLPGYKDVKPTVFAGLFPTDSDDYPDLRDALEKLKLNDASLFYEPETSQALGFGFRCGFLGLLHMEIVRERLEREFDLDLLVTAPNVAYRVLTKAGEEVEVHNPAEMPREIELVEEPYIRATTIVPKDFVGAVMELNNDRRGRYHHMEYLSEERVLLSYDLPLAEIVYDYYDQLKSRTKGYASFDYDIVGFEPGDLVRLDVLLAGDPVDALSLIVHRDAAYPRGRALVDRLREEIPRQMFDVPVQAAIGARIVARETIKARRKDVLAKCYGGDITRKRKLLERQKKGKKRMKQVGAVEVPQEAFLAVLNLDGERK
jgi:GTP-binding protein LepA